MSNRILARAWSPALERSSRWAAAGVSPRRLTRLNGLESSEETVWGETASLHTSSLKQTPHHKIFSFGW